MSIFPAATLLPKYHFTIPNYSLEYDTLYSQLSPLLTPVCHLYSNPSQFSFTPHSPLPCSDLTLLMRIDSRDVPRLCSQSPTWDRSYLQTSDQIFAGVNENRQVSSITKFDVNSRLQLSAERAGEDWSGVEFYDNINYYLPSRIGPSQPVAWHPSTLSYGYYTHHSYYNKSFSTSPLILKPNYS